MEIGFSQPTGLWVAQKTDEREKGDDASFKMDMTLIGKKGKERKRRLFIIRKDFDGKDKLLLKFTYPKDIKGTSFLVWEHKGRDNERFLYLPALGRIRRIATREKDENFVGTDFSYEDISGRKLEDYTYQLIEEGIIYEGKNCYLLASYPKEKGSKYPKILSWVRKDNFVVTKAEYYSKKGEIEKIYKVLKLEKIDGIWTSLELLMENLKTNHKTSIKVKEVQYNKGISDDRFERRKLKR
ncbi:MAG: outer membrane lipoprotein-sorting protein [Deltaproteobacteria bacterium]|nr:outer membrane lipoprotein-sorting protein [Deltaproteobacteria bacterium]